MVLYWLAISYIIDVWNSVHFLLFHSWCNLAQWAICSWNFFISTSLNLYYFFSDQPLLLGLTACYMQSLSTPSLTAVFLLMKGSFGEGKQYMKLSEAIGPFTSVYFVTKLVLEFAEPKLERVYGGPSQPCDMRDLGLPEASRNSRVWDAGIITVHY